MLEFVYHVIDCIVLQDFAMHAWHMDRDTKKLPDEAMKINGTDVAKWKPQPKIQVNGYERQKKTNDAFALCPRLGGCPKDIRLEKMKEVACPSSKKVKTEEPKVLNTTAGSVHGSASPENLSLLS